jgi:hypothetical protein
MNNVLLDFVYLLQNSKPNIMKTEITIKMKSSRDSIPTLADYLDLIREKLEINLYTQDDLLQASGIIEIPGDETARYEYNGLELSVSDDAYSDSGKFLNQLIKSVAKQNYILGLRDAKAAIERELTNQK